MDPSAAKEVTTEDAETINDGIPPPLLVITARHGNEKMPKRTVFPLVTIMTVISLKLYAAGAREEAGRRITSVRFRWSSLA